MRVAVALADGVAFVVRAFPRAAFARALVAIALDHASRLELLVALLARTLARRDAFAVVQNGAVRTTTT